MDDAAPTRMESGAFRAVSRPDRTLRLNWWAAWVEVTEPPRGWVQIIDFRRLGIDGYAVGESEEDGGAERIFFQGRQRSWRSDDDGGADGIDYGDESATGADSSLGAWGAAQRGAVCPGGPWGGSRVFCWRGVNVNRPAAGTAMVGETPW